MTCEGCANAVRDAIGRLAPAAAVVVDLERGEVAIADDIDPVAATAVIEAAGFGVARRGA
jgi:copper chaperone